MIAQKLSSCHFPPKHTLFIFTSPHYACMFMHPTFYITFMRHMRGLEEQPPISIEPVRAHISYEFSWIQLRFCGLSAHWVARVIERTRFIPCSAASS